jgi:hypothetical protein
LSRKGNDVGERGGREDNVGDCKRGGRVVVIIVKWGGGEGEMTLLSSLLLSR